MKTSAQYKLQEYITRLNKLQETTQDKYLRSEIDHLIKDANNLLESLPTSATHVRDPQLVQHWTECTLGLHNTIKRHLHHLDKTALMSVAVAATDFAEVIDPVSNRTPKPSP